MNISKQKVLQLAASLFIITCPNLHALLKE